MQPGQLVVPICNYIQGEGGYVYTPFPPTPEGVYTVKDFFQHPTLAAVLVIHECSVTRRGRECFFNPDFWRVVDENTELNLEEIMLEDVLEHV